MITKLGPHIQRTGQMTAESWQWLYASNIVKAMDDPSPLRTVDWSVVTIFRAFLPPVEQDTVSPADFFNLTVQRLGGFRPTFIEGLNEHRAQLSDGLESYIDWTTEFCRLAHAAGYKVCGFSFPTGCPDWDAWPVLRSRGFGGVDGIGMHAYWAKAGFTEWNALRYRKVHDLLGGDHPPFLLTEVGRDGVRDEGGEGQPGWHLQGVSAEDYVAELEAYDAELRKDDYVIGAVAFTAGAAEDWRQFELDSIADRIAERTEQTVLHVPTWQGGIMPWDRHVIYDTWAKSLGGQGANLGDAFGQAIERGLVADVGCFTSGYKGYGEEDCPYIYCHTTNGILYVPKAGASPEAVRFARREADLPSK